MATIDVSRELAEALSIPLTFVLQASLPRSPRFLAPYAAAGAVHG